MAQDIAKRNSIQKGNYRVAVKPDDVMGVRGGVIWCHPSIKGSEIEDAVLLRGCQIVWKE